MNIILKEDIEKVGRAGQKVKVAGGYARNFLIPQGLALEATQSNLKVLELHMKTRAKKLSAPKEQAEEMAVEVAGLRLVFIRKSGEEGKLFGSVTASDIGNAVLEKNVAIDKKKVLLDMPIKQLGEHRVKIRLHPEVIAEVTIEIKVEKEEKPIEFEKAESGEKEQIKAPEEPQDVIADETDPPQAE
ncbi:MAG: hypothetical protein IEMM0002_1568 [bacterium]|nr:MAG: hypothetical protein IEMM0002_1568 [bacterium]